MTDDWQAGLAELRLSVDRLTQGLQLMVETQERHSQMLREILVAATAPEPRTSALSEALGSVATGLRDQMQALNGVQRTLAGMPTEVGNAVTQSLRVALAEL